MIIAQAFETIARSSNFGQTAHEAGIGREGLYKLTSTDDNPSLATVIKVSRALGLRLRLETIA